MKKISLVLFGVAIILFNISLVSASTIYCSESGLITNYTLTIYKKKCDGYISFCTRFKADAPHGYNCTSTNWSSNSNKNSAIAYAIGYIIKSYGVSSFDYKYTLAESAINKFLYKITGDYSTYNNYYINISNSSTLNKYNTTINNAVNIYNNRKNGKDYTDSNNTKKIQISSKSLNNGTLDVTVKCYDQYGNKACTAPSVTATIGNSSYTMKRTSNEQGTATFQLDVSKVLATYQNSNNVTINIKASQTLNYCKADNYNCGDYQSMTPNKCTSIDEKNEATTSITTTGTKQSSDTCQNLVNKAKNEYKTSNPDKYYATLLQIYNAGANTTIGNLGEKCSDCDSKKFGEILNLSNPSCNEIENDTPNITCDGIKTTNNFIQKVSSNLYYCTSTFSLDTSQTIGSAYEFNYGDLLYYSADGVVANGTLSYSCQLPSGASISITPSLPTLSLSVFNKSVTFTSSLNNCGSVSCSSISLQNTNPTFNATVQYKYPDLFKYSLSKGSVFNVVTANDCLNGNCIPYGYGFKTDTSWNNGNSTLTISPASTIINRSSSTSCKYTAQPEDNKWTTDLIYRTIDTQSPFLTYNTGQIRTTGSNWCQTDESNDIVQKTVITTESQNIGIDIRNIYKDADSNDYTPTFDLNNNGYLDMLDIAMLQRKLTTNEKKVYFNSNFNLNDYIKYPGNTILSGAYWSDNYEDFISELYSNIFDYYELSKNENLNAEIYIISDVDDDLKYDFNGDGILNIDDVTILSNIAYSMFSTYGINYDVHPKYTLYSALGIKAGDVNYDGYINNTDYTLLENTLNGSTSLDVVQKYYADCDRNGYLNDEDKVCIINACSEEGGCNITISNSDEVMKDNAEFISRTDNEQFIQACSGSAVYNSTVRAFITNRPTADGKKTSDSNETTQPLYSFVLTPDKIIEIRRYNTTHNYNDFNLKCTDGYNCTSTFVDSLYADGTANVEKNDKCSDRTKFCEVIG